MSKKTSLWNGQGEWDLEVPPELLRKVNASEEWERGYKLGLWQMARLYKKEIEELKAKLEWTEKERVRWKGIGKG